MVCVIPVCPESLLCMLGWDKQIGNQEILLDMFAVDRSFLTVANFELYTDWLLWLLRRSVLSSG